MVKLKRQVTLGANVQLRFPHLFHIEGNFLNFTAKLFKLLKAFFPNEREAKMDWNQGCKEIYCI